MSNLPSIELNHTSPSDGEEGVDAETKNVPLAPVGPVGPVGPVSP